MRRIPNWRALWAIVALAAVTAFCIYALNFALGHPPHFGH